MGVCSLPACRVLSSGGVLVCGLRPAVSQSVSVRLYNSTADPALGGAWGSGGTPCNPCLRFPRLRGRRGA